MILQELELLYLRRLVDDHIGSLDRSIQKNTRLMWS